MKALLSTLARAVGWDVTIPTTEKSVVFFPFYIPCLGMFGWDLAEWLDRLTADAKVATVLGSIPAFSDTVESEGRQMKQCWIQDIEENKTKKSSCYVWIRFMPSGPRSSTYSIPIHAVHHLDIYTVHVFTSHVFRIKVLNYIILCSTELSPSFNRSYTCIFETLERSVSLLQWVFFSCDQF